MRSVVRVCALSVMLGACGGGVAGAPAPSVATPKSAAAEAQDATSRPCAASTRLLRSLHGPMHLDVYVTTSLPSLDRYVRDLRALLDAYQRASDGHFDYRVVDARTDADRRAAKDAGLVEGNFGERTSEDSASVTRGYLGIVFAYGGEKDAIKLLAPEAPAGLEHWITGKMREIRNRADAVFDDIGVLGGNDELSLDSNVLPDNAGQKSSIRDLMTKYYPYHRLHDVDARAPIPDTLDGLIITQPAKDLDEATLRRIDDFVLRGKRLVIVASAVNVTAGDARMQATLSSHGLEKLSAGYGIEIQRDALVDFGAPFTVDVATKDGTQKLHLPMLLDVEDDDRFTGDKTLLDARFPIFFRIPNVVFPFASSLVLHPEKQNGASMRVVARTTPSTARETTDSVDLSPFHAWKPGPDFAQYAIGAVVEGKLTSAFGGRAATKPASVLVLSSSQLFVNPLVRAGTGDESLQQLAMPYAQKAIVDTILVAKNTLDWITSDEDAAACW